MSKLLLKLNGVGDDEKEEILVLLEEHNISYYLTDAGRWRVGLSAIWLNQNEQYDSAKEILENYHEQRFLRFSGEREHLKNIGIISSLYASFIENPLRFILAIIGLIVVLSLSILPFLTL